MSAYCPFNSVATWGHVDMHLIGPNILVGIIEITAVIKFKKSGRSTVEPSAKVLSARGNHVEITLAAIRERWLVGWTTPPADCN